MELTPQQKLALKDYHNNTLISAGAGSGKTRVLTIRIINYLKQGIDINNLLVLTFTKAAAQEMKDRIRKGIMDEISLQEQILKIESAPINNFDAFYLSFVKKYAYLLNIDSNINIGDSSFFEVKKRQILTNIFDNLFNNNDEEFYQILRNNASKDETVLFNDLLTIYNKLTKKPNFDQYLDYLKNRKFDDNKIYKEYLNIFKEKITKINKIYLDLENKDHLDKINIEDLFNFKTYNDLINFFTYKRYPTISKKASDIDKELNELIKNTLKNIKESLIYKDDEDLLLNINYSNNNSQIFYKILKELNDKLMAYKYEINTFEFDDIAKMMISLLENNDNLRNEYKSRFYEILVDEYQDTNDIQERILNLLSNNNTYMVGDIKQSIYRFRNANCEIFKNKYLNYQNNIGGVKVDMNYNFRSRKAIIDNINIIFDNIMNLEYGGADYIKSHHMEAKNSLYFNEGKKDESDCLKILSYDKEDVKKIYGSESEYIYESLIIAKDILNKINSGYRVLKNNQLLPVSYSDFAIITRSKSHHDALKQVFEFFNIPLQSYTNEDMKKIDFIKVIKNLLMLYKCIYNNDIYSPDFRHCYLGVARSVLFSYTDQQLFDILTTSIKEKNYELILNSEIYLKMKNVINNYKYDSNINIFNALINEFDVYNSIIYDVDVLDSNTVINQTINMITSSENAKLTFIDFVDYYCSIIDEGFDISYESSKDDIDSVTLTNIHKSKGLEYKIIYFYNLAAKFNEKDVTDSKYLFDDEYGFIFCKNNISPLKDLLKIKEHKEVISEEIRLFYVALTRANENLIFVTNNIFDNDEFNLIEKNDFKNYNCLLNNLTTYFNNSNYVEHVKVDYPANFLQEIALNDDVKNYELIHKEINIPFNEIEKGHASNTIKEIIDKNTYQILQTGTKFHEILESIDYKNPDFSNLNNFYVSKIKSFINNLKNINVNIENATIYQEHEFYMSIDNKEINGIIDLLIEEEDKIVIIDYKLSNASVEKYKKQLEIYKKYVNSVSNKKCYTYLYSILQEEFKEVKL